MVFVGERTAIYRILPLFFLFFVLHAPLAVKPALATDAYDAGDHAPSYQENTVSTPLGLDELDALLPAHLRTPLPVSRGTVTTTHDSLAVADAPALQPVHAATPPSRIEKFYRDATGDVTLSQYGYDFLGTNITGLAPAAGAVADDYILGAGDRVNVAFLGERKDRATYAVDRTGALMIDHLPPIAAAGKTLGVLRGDLQHILNAQGYHGDVHLNLERVRQVGVLVAGHVAKPGRHAMTPLQTALEALEQSGGVTKAGSLRQIRLIRGGHTTIIDLYAFMDGSTDAPMPTLADGDRIIVPPLGPTIAVMGDARQPGIYELGAEGGIATAAALRLAGGPLARGENRISILTPQADGRRTAQLVAANAAVTLRDGAILSIDRTHDRPASLVTLHGETRKPGAYPLAQYPKLSRLLRHPEAFGDDVYPLMGVVSRRRDAELVRDLRAFSPQDVFAGRSDMDLQDGDALHILARTDVEAAMRGQETTLPPLLAGFVREHAVSLQGAVRLPGSWPVAVPVPVARLLDVAGGPLSDADVTRTEISRNDVGLVDVSAGAVSRRDVINLQNAGADSVTVAAGDAVRVPDRFEAVTRQAVTLSGEVRNPGTYDLMRGDTMLSLIERAGGLTDQAYPLGSVFSRASERRREKEKFSVAARDLERAIAMAAQDKDGKIDTSQMALAKGLVDELKTIEPVGRITVEADPAVLRREPAQDMLLEAGDRLHVPKRPLTVRVTGEVLSPAALQFRAEKKSVDYISEAGGFTLHADQSRMFVLFPNGSAQPVRAQSWARMKPLMIIPGSTIVVPRDPKPFSFIDTAKDITQILSNLAITGIYADDLINRRD